MKLCTYSHSTVPSMGGRLVKRIRFALNVLICDVRTCFCTSVCICDFYHILITVYVRAWDVQKLHVMNCLHTKNLIWSNVAFH